MPRSPALDREEPEPVNERDLPTPADQADPARQRQRPAGRSAEDDASRRQQAQSDAAIDNMNAGHGHVPGAGSKRSAG